MDIPLNVSHILDILSNYPKHWVTQIIWSEFRGGRYKHTVSVSERARACVRVCIYIYICVCVKETCTPDFYLGLFSWKTFFFNVFNTDPFDKCRFKKMCILSLRNDILAMCFFCKRSSLTGIVLRHIFHCPTLMFRTQCRIHVLKRQKVLVCAII